MRDSDRAVLDNLQRCEKRFFQEIVEGAYEECWIWQGARKSTGYGYISLQVEYRGSQIHVYAHRLSYIIYKGPISDDMLILHKCDNPPCVNPLHLFEGTISDNWKDMWEKGRGKAIPPSWLGKQHTDDSISKMRQSALVGWEKRRGKSNE